MVNDLILQYNLPIQVEVFYACAVCQRQYFDVRPGWQTITASLSILAPFFREKGRKME
jgi:hypothetical protein